MSEFLVFIKQMDTLTSHKSHDNYNMAYVVAYIQLSLIQFRQYVILEAPSQNLSHSRMISVFWTNQLNDSEIHS